MLYLMCKQKRGARTFVHAPRTTHHVESLRQIILLRVIAHHAVGAELHDERSHRPADFLNPLARDAIRIAIIEGGNHFLGQRLEKIRAVHAILFVHVWRVRIRADGETIRTVEAFAPPAVEDAEIQAAVATGFHAACAGRFERAARIVQPEVHALIEAAAYVVIVVLDEDGVPSELLPLAEGYDRLEDLLALLVNSLLVLLVSSCGNDSTQ